MNIYFRCAWLKTVDQHEPTDEHLLFIERRMNKSYRITKRKMYRSEEHAICTVREKKSIKINLMIEKN